MDELDLAIIRALQSNGRTANSEIARTLSVSETTIRNRVSRLLDEDLINIVAVPTPQGGRHDPLRHHRRVRTTDTPRRRHGPLGRLPGGSLRRHLDRGVRPDPRGDHEHLLTFITKRLGSLEGVTRVETSIILKVAKFSYEWEIPAN